MGQRTVPTDDAGGRLDAALARLAPEHSRSRWQALIEAGHVRVNGRSVSKCRTEVAAGDLIEWEEPSPRPPGLTPIALPIKIIYEDTELMAIDKPAGLVVHPAAGHEDATLVHALLYHRPNVRGIGGESRPGIVHRLDKGTSGLLVVAKTERAHRGMTELFKGRQVEKEYLAIVRGRLEPPSGTIETLIGRSASHRQKMTARTHRGRHAVTRYEVVSCRDEASLVRVFILTGRTHQIRVHMTHIGHPILGDPIYGSRRQEGERLGIARPMLHAHRLKFLHPVNGEPIELEAEIPNDMRKIMSELGLSI